MSAIATIWLPDAKFTRSAGASLATTLYRIPVTISLSGPLGAGKTTFLQGFFAGLGVEGHVVSPTYALEQHYQSDHGEILHIDLYRLDEAEAKQHIDQTDDHSGIRCIEWSDRAEFRGDIHIDLEEKDNGRQLTVTFNDMQIPTIQQITAWRDEVDLPSHIISHCDAVAGLSEDLGKLLLERGILVRPKALKHAAMLHDLLRFVDFKPGGAHRGHAFEESPAWEPWKKKFDGVRHEPACAELLKERGFPEIASIVAVHGIRLPPKDRVTLEQKLVYYADKRMMVDKKVTLQERFDDFFARYGDSDRKEEGKIWFKEASEAERELFPEGIPL